MATRRMKRRTRRRSCKNGKLKRPVRTKKGGKRRCKKSKRKSKKSRKSYKMRGLEDMPNEILTGIFENSSFDDLKRLYNTNRHMRSIAIQVVRGKIMDGYDLFESKLLGLQCQEGKQYQNKGILQTPYHPYKQTDKQTEIQDQT